MAATQPLELDVSQLRARYGPLRDAFVVEQESGDYLSLHRVTADVVKPLIYTGNKVQLDFLLRSLAAEFFLALIDEVSSTPAYYPTGEKAWSESFPTLETRSSLDNRYCAFNIIVIMADTVLSVARRLSHNVSYVKGVLRLMFNMYIRAINPLQVEDGTPTHDHIPQSSPEPRIWIAQWRSMITSLVLLSVHDVSSIQTAWNEVLKETEAGADKVKVKGASLLDVLSLAVSNLENKGLEALDEGERLTLSEFTRFLTLVGKRTQDMQQGDREAWQTAIKNDFEKNRDHRVACSGCGTIHSSENALQACGRCQIVLYCSDDCQTTDWNQYHKDACGYPVT